MTDIPPGFRLVEPPAAGPDDLPPGFKLVEPAPSREQEIRAEKLKALMQMPSSGYSNRLKDAITSGLARPMGGAMSVVGGEVGELFGGKPATVGERWRGGVAAEEDYAKAKEKESEGILGTGTSILGSLAGAGTATAPLGLGREVLRAGAQGGIEGAARNAETLGGAAGGAAAGAAVSGGTTGILGGLLDRLGRVVGARRDIGTASRGGNAQTLQAEGSELFTRLDNAGIHFSGRETPELANRVNAAIAPRYNPNIHREADAVIQEINDRVTRGAMTYGEVRNIQTQISDLKASPDKRVRALAGDMANAVDSFMHTARPTIPAGSVGQVSPGDLDRARDLWRRASLTEKVERAAEKGMITAKDPAAKTQRNFENLGDKFRNPDRYNPANPEQMRLIDRIAEGSPTKAAAADTVNRWSSNLLGYGTAGAAGGAVLPSLLPDSEKYGTAASGAGAGAIAAGLLGKGGSSIMRRQLAETASGKVDDLLRNIATGSTAQAPGAYVPRNALAILLAKQDLARGAGKVVSSNIDEEYRP